MIPEQPGMQQQPQVDPQVMQISEMFTAAVQEGQQPQEVLMGLMQQEVDQNIIGQALMQLGYEEEAIISLFEDVQKLQQPQEPSPQQITNNPQQLARAEEIQKEAPGMDMNITSIDQAKSGIEIKPENKGKFTRWAKARGMSVSEAYNKVMSSTDNYPASVVKMANFAKNAAGWNKQEGGTVETPEVDESFNSSRGQYFEDSGSFESPESRALNISMIANDKMLREAMYPREGGSPYQRPQATEQFKKGGEFEPHFMYKGDRKIRARDMATHLRLKEAGYNHEAPKAADGVETGAVQNSEQGNDNLNMMSSFLNASNTTITDTSKDPVKTKNKGLISNLEDEGILEPGPMYINPAIFNNNEFNLGKAANVLMSGYEDMFSGKDKDGDGVKDGSFRDWRGKHINNKMQKMANATYDIKLDLSDENKNAAATWFKQFQVENPDAAQQKDALGNIIKTEADKILDDINAPSAVKKISDDLLEKWQSGSAETKAYIESILKRKGQEIPTEYKVDPMSAGGKDPGATSKDPQEVDLDPGFDMKLPESIENNDPGFDMFIPKDYDGPLDPGFNQGIPNFSDYERMLVKYGAEIPNMQMAGPVANQKLSFKEWVMQDPVTRGGANGPQLYAEYEAEFDNPFNPTPPVAQTNDVPVQRTAADLFTDINAPEVDANYGGVGGFLDRALNSTVATAFGDISNFAVGAADVANDWFDERNKKKAQEELRGDLVADNIYGTKTDAFNKRGTFDINSGLMGSEGDATTGLYMNAKFGGGVNNAGFKALPAEAQHNILSNMAYGGAKGEEAYLANRDRVIKRELSKYQDKGETRKERKDRIKNYDHEYLDEYIELFKNKNKGDVTAIKDIMSQMGVTQNDTLFVGNSNNASGAKMFPQFKLQQYLASQIDPEAYNAGEQVIVNHKNKAPYYTSEPDPEDGKSYSFENKTYYDDSDGYIHLIKSKKQNGGEQTVEVDSRMLAKLIAAGADIEKL